MRRPARRMMPMGSSSSNTKGRLVIERAFPVVGYDVVGQYVCHTLYPTTPYPTTGNRKGRVGLRSLRHVQGRVQLTLGLGRREAGARLDTTAPHDLPSSVLRLQRFRGERNDLAGRGAGQDHVYAARTGARLELRHEPVAVARSRGREGGGIDHHDAGRHVWKPAP